MPLHQGAGAKTGAQMVRHVRQRVPFALQRIFLAAGKQAKLRPLQWAKPMQNNTHLLQALHAARGHKGAIEPLQRVEHSVVIPRRFKAGAALPAHAISPAQIERELAGKKWLATQPPRCLDGQKPPAALGFFRAAPHGWQHARMAKHAFLGFNIGHFIALHLGQKTLASHPAPNGACLLGRQGIKRRNGIHPAAVEPRLHALGNARNIRQLQMRKGYGQLIGV